MQLPPCKPNKSIFAKSLGIHVLWVGMLMGAICFGTQACAIVHDDPKWQTYVFTVLCLCQMGHAMAIRSERFFLFRQGFLTNPALLGTVLLTFLLQLTILYAPTFQAVFSTQPLIFRELAACVLISLVVFHAVEVEKLVRGWRRKSLKGTV
ncbi:MAG: cation transporting ATPase C-terminal domain-containing protein [Saprospiraceae bacterium]|nr:cation transporting ATPase C-terminal domain-containing protein [Saprospiraceae bacterium]MCF8250228.1 cation transporting ATPase C-terminal domain-containing protein [Saprospiraceae bacterium]MCF8280009.1 cation transporting ATPase C-terminal domain-containing protein [Bacteroidales bacterium]MCF8312036.1 cation transporting ATPase C-terminal domain-containing protein [Saprospiraceae bacterium]MCF8441133.1 cation transporting ATPase C-terminal domain-containing protein [Saprospiraceae bacte